MWLIPLSAFLIIALLAISVNNSKKTSSPLQLEYHPFLVSSQPSSSVLGSPDHLSIMSETLRKRGREPQALVDSIDAGYPKRFCSEETDRFLHLLQLDKTLSEDDDDDCAPSEELVNKVMKSLEEEIAATSSTSHHISNSGDNWATDIASRDDQDRTQDSDLGDDICYPWDASHGEPAIPPNPILDLNDETCQSPKRTMDGLLESMDVKSLAENWHLEDDFESYQQFALYEDAWMPVSQLQDCINRDFVSQDMLFDGDFSAGWKLSVPSNHCKRSIFVQVLILSLPAFYFCIIFYSI